MATGDNLVTCVNMSTSASGYFCCKTDRDRTKIRASLITMSRRIFFLCVLAVLSCHSVLCQTAQETCANIQCKHGGTCVDLDEEFTASSYCVCPKGYFGIYCQIDTTLG